MNKITAADAARLAAMVEEAHNSDKANDDGDDDGDFVIEVARTVQAADVERVSEADETEDGVMSVQARAAVAAADYVAGRAAEEAGAAAVTGEAATEGGLAETREQGEIPSAARVLHGSAALAEEPEMSEVMRRQQRSPRGYQHH
jgi:hypothetical protein